MIYKLNETVESLRNIRSLEESFDKTVDDLTNQLSEVLQPHQIYGNVADEETVETNTHLAASKAIVLRANRTYQSSNTSVWSCSDSNRSGISELSNPPI